MMVYVDQKIGFSNMSKCGRFSLGVSLQLENYAKTEEAKVEELIKAVADSGAKVIVSGGAVGEMALHFCERYKYIEFPFHSSNCAFCSFFYRLSFRIAMMLNIKC